MHVRADSPRVRKKAVLYGFALTRVRLRPSRYAANPDANAFRTLPGVVPLALIICMRPNRADNARRFQTPSSVHGGRKQRVDNMPSDSVSINPLLPRILTSFLNPDTLQ